MARARIGVWLVGARGGVATTSVLGLTALRKGLAGHQGLVSQLPLFEDLQLASWKDFAVGGHDIRPTSLLAEAEKLHQVSRALDEGLIARCKSDLQKIDRNIRPGILFNVGRTIEGLAAEELRDVDETPRQAIARVQQDLNEFVAEQGV